MGYTRRAKGSRRVEDKREKEMVNTKTWRDELRRQGTAFPAWGQADSNAPKSSPFAKENNNPRYESMYRMGGSENQPQWKKNLRSEGPPSCLGPRPIRTTTFSKTVTLAWIRMKALVPLLRRRKESSESKRNTCRPSHVAQRMEIK